MALLCGTDFSEASAQAACAAACLAARGREPLHLVHALDVPAAKGTQTRVHVLFSESAAPAICQAAERLGVDMICIGTRGRSGIAKAVLGSVATSVLSNTGRPVLLAHRTRR